MCPLLFAGICVGEASVPGPVRIHIQFDQTVCVSMCDSGSDFDAMSSECSELFRRRGNASFVRREAVSDIVVSGYTQDMSAKATHTSTWRVKFTGAQVVGGPLKVKEHEITFVEFDHLGDPVVLGIPCIDRFGGTDITPSHVWIAGLWSDRLPELFRQRALNSAYDLPRCIGQVARRTAIGNKGDYEVEVAFPIETFAGVQRACIASACSLWCDGSLAGDENISVVSAPVSLGDDSFDECGKVRMKVLVQASTARHVFSKGTSLVLIRPETLADSRSVASFHEGWLKDDPALENTWRICAAKYKARDRTNDQAKLFPELMQEIEKRRSAVRNQTYKDQNSDAYRDEICQIAKDKHLIPDELYDEVCARILRPYSDRFWHEGCEPPKITNFRADLRFKPSAVIKARQPYSLSKFDEARLAYLLEEEVAEGKLERLEAGEEPPPMVTPTFIVDKKGSLIGRRVGDYTDFNRNTEDYFYPAPDADSVLMRGTGKRYHSTFDCVWGFSIIENTEQTARMLSVITHIGVFKVKSFPYGPKQGPPLYQHMQDDTVGQEYKPTGEKLADVFFDDTHIADHQAEDHVASLIQLLECARRNNIQYRLTKCLMFQRSALLLGFMVGELGRTVDPAKTEQLRAWPEYRSIDDMVSHVAFCQYLKEFYGPKFPVKVKPLRAYSKSDASFANYATDVEAQEARRWLIETLVENVTLNAPDWKAAAEPWNSGRPFEGFFDASDLHWCVVLTQRERPDGPPRIIGLVSRSFEDAATRWSAFEREYFCLKEGYNAIAKWVTGFKLFVHFDHKNIDFAESVLKTRRASKKLVSWIADTQEMIANVVRVWIAGKDNILADVGSRLSWMSIVAGHLPVPDGPIQELMDKFFTHPLEIDEAVERRRKVMGKPEWTPVSPHGVTEKQGNDPVYGVPLEEESAPKRGTSKTKTTSSKDSASSVSPSDIRQKERFEADTPSVPSDSASGPLHYDIATPSEDASFHSFPSDYDGEGVPVPDDHDLSSVDVFQDDDAATTVTYYTDRDEIAGDRGVGNCMVALPEATPKDRISSATVRREDRNVTLVGLQFEYWLFEISSKTSVLSQAVRLYGMSCLSSGKTESELETFSDETLRYLKALISTSRPLLTHISLNKWHLRHLDRISDLVMTAVRLHLFVCIDVTSLGNIALRLQGHLSLEKLSGMQTVKVHMCMFPHSNLPQEGYTILSGLLAEESRVFLTNAPWIARLCTPCEHKEPTHSELRMRQYNASLYPWSFAVAYAKVLKTAPVHLKHLRRLQPVVRTHPWYLRVSRKALTQTWPDVPLTFCRGALEEYRTIAGGKARFDKDPTAFDDEFNRLCRWLATQGIVANKVVHYVRTDGQERYEVHFVSEIVDIRDGRQKGYLAFLAYGKDRKLLLGKQKAASLAHVAYAASHMTNPLSDRFGVGVRRADGFHGNDRHEFRIRTVSTLMELTGSGSWNPMTDSFVPKEAFCVNCVVSRMDGQTEVCKCLGHFDELPDIMHPERIVYADSSVGQVRTHKDEVYAQLRKLVDELVDKQRAEAPAGSAISTEPSVLLRSGFFGARANSESEYIPAGESHIQVVDACLRLYHATIGPGVPITSLLLGLNIDSIKVEGDTYAYALFWPEEGKMEIEYTIDAGESKLSNKVPVHISSGQLLKFQAKCRTLVFSCAPAGSYDDHREALEQAGFPIPSSLRVLGFQSCLTTLGIERGRLLQLYKLGYDTAPVMQLLLNGASRLSPSSAVAGIPDWAGNDTVSSDLRTIAMSDLPKPRILAEAELTGLRDQIKFEILGGWACERLKRMKDSGVCAVNWNAVQFRLTLAWDALGESTLTTFEIAGPAMSGTIRAVVEAPCDFALVLFLGGPRAPPTPRAVDEEAPAEAAEVDPIDERIDEAAPVIAPGHRVEDIAYVEFDGENVKFGDVVIADIARKTGLKKESLVTAMATIQLYRLHLGRLQKKVYDKSTGFHDWHTVVPYGEWRTVTFQGVKRFLNLRRLTVLMYHVTDFGGHKDRDGTLRAIQDSGMWWSDMYTTVNQVIKHCWTCQITKAQPYITGLQRSRDYDGPFRYIVIDFVGPQMPETTRGNVYMFTATCAWSGWYWAVPTPNDTGETAARCLAERVIFDIAGVPVMLGSDRAKAFTEGVIKALSQKLGIQQVIGSAYNPEAQSAVERPHRTYKTLCRQFMTDVKKWDDVAPLFQWVVRTTCKEFNGTYTPYETVTGLKPRLALDSLVAPTFVTKVSTETYVQDLVAYLKKLHKFVDEQHTRVREREAEARLRRLGTGEPLKVGDYVLYKSRDKTEGISDRFKPSWRSTIYQIVDSPGGEGKDARVFVLCDPATGHTDNLGFTNPVASKYLHPVEVLPYAKPHSDGFTKINLEGKGEGVVTAQCLDGRVYVRFNDNEHPELIDLSRHNYTWTG